MSLALHIAAAWITASTLLAALIARAAHHRHQQHHPRPRPTPAHPEGPHMSDRLTVDTINSDQLDALQLRAARMEHATKHAAELAVRLEDAEAGITAAIRQRKEQEDRALRAEARLARAWELHREDCPFANGELSTNAFGCSMCDVLDQPVPSAPATTQATDQPKEQ